jgi:signal transduction histidine kinase
VQLELAPSLALVSAHKGQLQQVILNLISNAADAMRSNTDRTRVLTMKSETTAPDHVAISIRDTGMGIDAQSIARIFDAFFTTKPNGMGMGLAICRSIVDAHGGTLSAVPRAPHGAEFRMVLPRGHDADTAHILGTQVQDAHPARFGRGLT